MLHCDPACLLPVLETKKSGLVSSGQFSERERVYVRVHVCMSACVWFSLRIFNPFTKDCLYETATPVRGGKRDRCISPRLLLFPL